MTINFFLAQQSFCCFLYISTNHSILAWQHWSSVVGLSTNHNVKRPLVLQGHNEMSRTLINKHGQ